MSDHIIHANPGVAFIVCHLALCDHRAVRSGGDGGVCYPLPDPPAEEASSLAVDLPSSPQDQGVPSVWA